MQTIQRTTLVALFAITTALLVAPSFARASSGKSSPQSPYAGQQARQTKALSEAETAEYLEGGGMGLAKAAELNGYPGPKHVLGLAVELALSDDQRFTTESVFTDMLNEAQRLGALIVAAEAELDEAFRTGQATAQTVDRLTHEVARLQGDLRAVHLRAHLAQARILSAEQIRRYAELRGYGSGDAKHDHEHAH